MAVRPPQNLRLETGASVLDYELLGEKAATLGRVGDRAGKAMARLHAFDAGDREGTTRAFLVEDAAEAVWHFFIQRELCGMRDHKSLIAQLNIPREVLGRLGAAPRR